MSWTPQRMALSPGDFPTPASSSRLLKRKVHHGANSSGITETILSGLDQDDCSEDGYSSDSGPSSEVSRKTRRLDKSISENISHALPLGSLADVLAPAITVNAPESTGTTITRESETVQLLQSEGGIPPPPQPPIPDPTGSYSTDRPSPLMASALRYGIFLADAPKPTVLSPTPIHPRAPIESTLQLVFCAKLLLEDQHRSTSQCNPTEVYVLDDAGRHWFDAIQEDPSAQTRIRWLVSRLVAEFLKDPSLGPEAIFEVVILGPVLCEVDYRHLLSCLIERFDQSALLNASLLQGMIQLLQSAPPGFLTDDDLVRILSSLRKRLESIHAPDRIHVYQLVFAVSKVLEVMVRGEVKGLNRQRDHQSLLTALRNLKGVDDDEFLKFQISYAYQMSLYLPDDETAAVGASAVARVFKLDPTSALTAVKHIQQIAGNAIDVVMLNIDGSQAAENAYWSQKKQPWFLALQAGYLFVRDGRLVDFNRLVCDATCRDDVNFQRGVCQILGEIALNPLWDDGSRRSAIDFLGELCKTDAGQRKDFKVRRWVATVLQQISSLVSPDVSSHARTLLGDLQKEHALDIEGCRALHTPLPIPTIFPLLEKALSITDIDHELARIRFRSLEECLHPISIPLRAKATLRAPKNQSFPLMAKVLEFLRSDKLVFLLLGDSGSGKSTFCRQLERELWNQHEHSDGRIPLYINLPSIDDPHCSLIEKYLKHHHNILESIIQNIKDRRQFVLICDGYDESRLIQNLYTTNRLNRPGQWNVKMIVTCRSIFLSRGYQCRFYPIGDDIYRNNSLELFEEATIVPFQESDIQEFVKQYVDVIIQESSDNPSAPSFDDYWEKLSAIPNVMNLVSNPFLLTLALRAIPSKSIEGLDSKGLKAMQHDLYDGFMQEWTRLQKIRLQGTILKQDIRAAAFEVLLTEGFSRCVIDYLKRLADAIYQYQDGRPVVKFSRRHMEDWKVEFFGPEIETTLLRDASPLTRAGIRHWFIHKSLLDYFYNLTFYDPDESDDDDSDDSEDGDDDSRGGGDDFHNGRGNTLGDGGDGLADDNGDSVGGNEGSTGGNAESTDRNGGSSGGNGGSSGGNGGSTSGNQDSSGGESNPSGGSSGSSSRGNNDGSRGDKNGSNGDEDGSRRRKDDARSKRKGKASKSRSSTSSDPFSKRNLFKEPSVLQFLVERAESDPRLKKRLFSAIEHSKVSSVPSMAAANAITILFKSGNLSQDAVLDGVLIPSDYTSTATRSTEPVQLPESNLTGGDLIKVLVTPESEFTAPATALTVAASAPTVPASIPLSTKDRADALLLDLKKGDTTEFPGSHSLRRRPPLPTASSLLAKVQEIPKFEYNLHALRLMRLREYSQTVYISPMAKLSLQDTDDNLFPLMDKVRDFLAGDSQVMLILGDSGTGKSTFNRHLEHELWKEYKPGGRIPLFINLPSFERPEKDLIAEQLRTYKFSETEIQEIEQRRQFVLICDGYDESQLTSNLHTTNSLNRSGQRDAKLLIACRSQYLGTEYRLRFEPQAANQYNRAVDYLFMEAVIAPFSKEQIEDYVERYVPLEPRTWRTEDYMDKLTTIPDLMDLVKNPFLLSLALEALPGVVEGKQDLSTIMINRAQLYDTFVEHWSNVNKRRLQSNTLSMADRIALDELLDMGFISKSIDFSTRLALAIFEQQDGNPIVQYIHEKNSWKAQFFGHDVEVRLLRDSSPLTRTGNLHRFLHRSMLEYFLSRAIFDPSKLQDHDGPIQQTDYALSDAPLIDTNSPLFTRNLLTEPSVIHFLSDRVKQTTWFRLRLLTLVELSRSDDRVSQAAANAITILVRAGVHFNSADLRGIRIAGADLSNGQFDSAQFQGADLTGVNFSKAWIRQADLSRACMDRTRFGEQPHLEELERVSSCAFSPKGKYLAAGLDNGDISIYDTATWIRIQLLQGHQKAITSLAYSPDSEQLLSGSDDKTVRLWDSVTGSTDFILEGHSDLVRAVAFSPTGQQFASASEDKSVRLWDARTGDVVLVLTDNIDKVTSIAYSPNGNTIASTSWHETIQIFDTLSGLLVLKSCKGNDRIMCTRYSLDGRWIATGSDQGRLQLLEVTATTLNPGRKWTAHTDEITSIDFSPDDRWIASSSLDHTVQLWDSCSGALISSFVSHMDYVNCARFSPNGSYIVSASNDNTLRLWMMNSLGSGFDSHDKADPQFCATYSPDGRLLLAGSQQRPMRQLNADSGDADFVFPDHLYNINCIAFSPDGLQIAIGNGSEEVTIWSVTLCTTTFVLSGHKSRVASVAFSPCGRWLVSGSKDKTMRLWDARSGAAGHVLEAHAGDVQSVAFSPDGCWIASVCKKGIVQLWEVSTGELKAEKTIDIGYNRWNAVVYKPGCLQAASSHGDGTIRLWDDDQQLQGFRYIVKQDHEIYQFAFSSCGQWVATTHGTNVRLWRMLSPNQDQQKLPLQDQNCASVIEGFTKDVVDVVWRPNELEFATASAEGSIRAWRVMEDTHGSGRVSVRLLWSSGPAILAASGAILHDTVGLSLFDRKLLEQRGATSVTD